MPQPKNDWDAKYLREQPFMAFGSMCNAYGLINEGKGMSIVEFLVGAEMIFEKANEFAQRNFDKVEAIKESVEEQV